MLHRYAEARQIGQGLADEALAALARSMAAPGPVVVNPSAAGRGGLVEVVVPVSGAPGPHVQVLSERAGLPGSITLDGETVRNMLGLIQGARIDEDAYITDVSLAEDDTGLDVTVVIGSEPRHGVPVEEVKRELFTRLTARPDTEVRLRLDQPPVRRLLARQRPVEGFGWARFEPDRWSIPYRWKTRAVRRRLTNGLVRVTVDPADGTFALDGVPGYGRLVDGGDHGDTYNYSPPRSTRWSTRPTRCRWPSASGAGRATVTISSEYVWPDRVDGDTKTRVGSHRVPVDTTLELRADEPVVRVRTRFVNPARDHRLRVHLPLPSPAATSQAECAFTVVERGLVAEGRPDEFGLPTFPSRRFVSSGRAHRGPRGPARVRAGRRGLTGRFGRHRGGPDLGPHAPAGNRDAVPVGHDPPTAHRRSHDCRWKDRRCSDRWT